MQTTNRAPVRHAHEERWTGWIFFAGLMMVVVGFFNIIDGLAAIGGDAVYVDEGRIAAFSTETWGWIWLISGIAILAAGFATFRGQVWGRAIGILLAGLNAIGQLTFVSANPFWAALVIGFDAIIIYALTVHGGRGVPYGE